MKTGSVEHVTHYSILSSQHLCDLGSSYVCLPEKGAETQPTQTVNILDLEVHCSLL